MNSFDKTASSTYVVLSLFIHAISCANKNSTTLDPLHHSLLSMKSISSDPFHFLRILWRFTKSQVPLNPPFPVPQIRLRNVSTTLWPGISNECGGTFVNSFQPINLPRNPFAHQLVSSIFREFSINNKTQ